MSDVDGSRHAHTTFPNGMECLSWGRRPRSLLFLVGGPGSSLPAGLLGRLARRWFAPFVEAGYAVHLDGHADLVVGMSFGGMVAQHLAARHGGAAGRFALVASACRVSDWGKEVDGRLSAAVARGDRSAAGEAFAEYVVPGPRGRWWEALPGYGGSGRDGGRDRLRRA
jgi:pimeloyl-ACP methyl ester carboxylesterase